MSKFKFLPLGLVTTALMSASSLTLAQDVQLPSASIDSQAQLDAMIDAPAPQVNAESSALEMANGNLLPEILAAIAAEQEALKRRSAALDLRESEIGMASAALSEQERQLTLLQDEILSLLERAEANHTADVTRLVSIYRNMKPVEAAAILSTADLEVTVLVLAAMPERDAGPIIAQMDPIRAQAVSKIILERSRLPGDQNLVNLKINQ